MSSLFDYKLLSFLLRKQDKMRQIHGCTITAQMKMLSLKKCAVKAYLQQIIKKGSNGSRRQGKNISQRPAGQPVPFESKHVSFCLD